MTSKSNQATSLPLGALSAPDRHDLGQAVASRLQAATRGLDVREVLGGVFLFALGLFAALYAQRYAFGSLTRMGPGFFPVVLGVLLCVYGGLIALLAFVRRDRATPLAAEASSEEPEPVQWRNLLFVTTGLALFGVLLTTAGMVVATIVAVGLYSLADRTCNVPRSVVLAALITGLTWVLFIWGLRMTVPVWWN